MGKRTKEYYYEVGEVVNETLEILEKTRVPNGKSTCRGYIVKSLIYPSAQPYKKREYDLRCGDGCAYVAGIRICKENSLYSVENIRDNLINIEQAKTIAPNHSKEKILFKCSNEGCNNTKKMMAYTLVKNGFSCQNCSSNISYGERVILSINEYFDLGLEYQIRLSGLDRLICDFVDFSNKIVYEVQGIQHYEARDFYGGGKQFIKQKSSDSTKKEYCENIGWKYIEIDARYSDFNFIRDNINKVEHLPNIDNSDEKAIMELIEISSKYNVEEIIKLYTVDFKSVIKIGKLFNVSGGTISNILKRNGVKIRKNYETRLKGTVINRDEIVKMYTVDKLSTCQIAKNLDISNCTVGNILKDRGIKLRDNKKEVRCITTGKIFPSVTEAKKWALKGSKISEACSGSRRYAGLHPKTNEKLYWEYVD